MTNLKQLRILLQQRRAELKQLIRSDIQQGLDVDYYNDPRIAAIRQIDLYVKIEQTIVRDRDM